MNTVNQSMGAVSTQGSDARRAALLVAQFALGFGILWVIFNGLFRAFPYLRSGAEVIYRAKIDQEMTGAVFPANVHARRLMIFGDSRILAGFVPAYFDSLPATNGSKWYSYNSGYPSRGEFVTELEEMTRRESGTPDVVLLTAPWGSSKQRFSVFRPLQGDHQIAEQLFPFRYMVRDAFSFLMTSKEHGGLRAFYRESRMNVSKMIEDRGYYFISQESHFPNDSLPDDLHFGSDRPSFVETRFADERSTELEELNRIVKEKQIHCYYVPEYGRIGAAAPALAIDQKFADLLQRHSSCKLLGPDYYLYPNRMFSDAVHLNRQGAKIYTEAIYQLVAKAEGGR